MLKNRFFTILLMLILATPVYAELEDDVQNIPTVEIEQIVDSESQEVLTEPDAIQYKQPVSRRKIAKKFLLAMSGVGVSSVLLFGGLSFYNKVRENILAAAKEVTPYNETSLTAPDSLTDAIKTFLDKTNWG